VTSVVRRTPLLLWTGALACAVLVLFAGTRDVFWNGDFMVEAWPAYKLLIAGDVHGYLTHLPGYTGFVLTVGGPAAFFGGLIGGHETAAYRLSALPALIAMAWLAVVLTRHALHNGLKGWPLVLVLIAGGPLVLRAIVDGHPEEALATAAAVGAVLTARSGRPTAAALLLVGAVVAKQSAILAVGPALLAAPSGHRRLALIAGTGILAVIAAEMLVHPMARGTLTSTGDLFHPQQVWWPFGVEPPASFTEAGHGLKTSPEWLRPITHPLIVAIAVPLSLAWWRRPNRNLDDALALLALLFLLRCLLDPWNLGYYHLPLVTALIAWEVRAGRDWPLLGLAVSLATWFTFIMNDGRVSDRPFLLYMAWALPLAAHLAHRLYVRRAPLPYRRSWPVDPTSAGRLSSPSTSTT
jgi:hypothetical protein